MMNDEIMQQLIDSLNLVFDNFSTQNIFCEGGLMLFNYFEIATSKMILITKPQQS